MSLSHHGDKSEIMQRFLDQVNGKTKRQYSAGRMGAEDDGDLAFAIATDTRRSVIIIRFGKPVEWIGLGISDTERLIEQLEERLRELRGVPA